MYHFTWLVSHAWPNLTNLNIFLILEDCLNCILRPTRYSEILDCKPWIDRYYFMGHIGVEMNPHVIVWATFAVMVPYAFYCWKPSKDLISPSEYCP